MARRRIMVEVGNCERKRCTVVEAPATGANGGLWARARYRGEEFAITELAGAWLKQDVWEHTCRVLGISGRSHDAVRKKLKTAMSKINFTD